MYFYELRINYVIVCLIVATWFNTIKGRRIVCSKKGKTFKKHVKRYVELTISPPTLNLFKTSQSEKPSAFYSLSNGVSEFKCD